VTKPPKAKSPTSSTSSSFQRLPPVSGSLFWQGKLTVGDHQLKRGFAGEVKTVKKANNKVVIIDPTGLSNDAVIKTRYKKVSL
jgi:hypothetical protein